MTNLTCRAPKVEPLALHTREAPTSDSSALGKRYDYARQLPESVLDIAVRRCGMLHYRVPDANRRASCPWPCSSGLQARATPSPARANVVAGAPGTKPRPDLLPPPFVSHLLVAVLAVRATLWTVRRDLSRSRSVQGAAHVVRDAVASDAPSTARDPATSAFPGSRFRIDALSWCVRDGPR